MSKQVNPLTKVNYKVRIRTSTKIAFAFCFVFVPCASAQQITGRFYPEKEEYLVGEPITVMFELLDTGADPIQIADSNCPAFADPLQVDNAPPGKKLSLFGCLPPVGTAGSCLSASRDIEPGGTFRKRYLLRELDSPGLYHVQGTRKQGALNRNTNIIADFEIHSEFDVKVRRPNDGELERVYEPFLSDLSSRDFTVRDFAAYAVTQNPPPFTEAAVLALAEDQVLASEAIEGMKRLATPAARAKLVQMSGLSSPEYFRQPAITALGEIGYPDDCDAMLDIASQSKNYTQVLAYAAAGRICREKAIPLLYRLVSSAGPQLVAGLLHGLGNSSSRDAVPALINALQSPDASIRREAMAALVTLTHMQSQYGIMSDDSAKQAHSEWIAWWSANRTSALIYSPDQCTAPQLLR